MFEVFDTFSDFTKKTLQRINTYIFCHKLCSMSVSELINLLSLDEEHRMAAIGFIELAAKEERNENEQRLLDEIRKRLCDNTGCRTSYVGKRSSIEKV